MKSARKANGKEGARPFSDDRKISGIGFRRSERAGFGAVRGIDCGGVDGSADLRIGLRWSKADSNQKAPEAGRFCHIANAEIGAPVSCLPLVICADIQPAQGLKRNPAISQSPA